MIQPAANMTSPAIEYVRRNSMGLIGWPSLRDAQGLSG
jgi:hypothetical protein